MTDEAVLELRCTNHLAEPSDDPYGHLGASIRLPMKAAALGEILAALGDCPCGASLIVVTEDGDG